MFCQTGLRWVLLSAFLYTVSTQEARRRPRQCEAPRSESDMNSFLWTVRRDPASPPSYLFRHDPRALHAGLGLHPRELQTGLPPQHQRLLRAGPDRPADHLQTDQLPAPAPRREPGLAPPARTLPPPEAAPGLRQARDAPLDDAGPAGPGLYADYLFNAITGNWERKRPVWVMLMVNSLTEWDVRLRGSPVLDLHLAQEAERLGKRTGAVERVEEQCHPLNGLNFSQVLFALNQTLLQHEGVRAGSLQGSYTTEDLISHYNCGDLSSIIFNHDTSQLLHFNNSSLPSRPSRLTATSGRS
ncbi:hypothetical protein COCON_G00059990 [Conger conger]|uniref:Metalloprotease TIKI n=1 Tax=Conger conger TaxID=82655 RepID=A0A9Q1DRA6_CONCO|nr:hypothetical protein COCON_G00059990 [Conger conger]